ncbi:MAG: hypothetical protein HXY18_09410 [Bryobacteraceae bacterium]|nr:hypothetical protein [Bryobacteraceae bacterium]
MRDPSGQGCKSMGQEVPAPDCPTANEHPGLVFIEEVGRGWVPSADRFREMLEFLLEVEE